MHYADFASQLERHPDAELVFEIGATTIGRGHHVTEVLRQTVDGVDCGGSLDHWRDTVLQLVESPAVDGRPGMSARTAEVIPQRTEQRLALAADNEAVLEFRPADAMAAQRYHVTDVASGIAGAMSATRRLAEALIHDVFMKAVRAIHEGRAPGNLVDWLHQVSWPTITDHYRARRLDVQPLVHEAAVTDAPDSAAFQDLASGLQPLAATLPTLYRVALHSADFQGQRLAVLATTAGVTVSAFKSRVSRARAMLRKRVLVCCPVSLGASGRVADVDIRAPAEAGCACAPTPE